MTAEEPAPGASAALARALAPELVTAGVERPIVADQTNRSVVVDETVIVKWFRPPVPAPRPGIRLLEHLAAAGFSAVPRLHGGAEVAGHVVATVSEFVADAVDGWEWFVAEPSLDHARLLGSLGGQLHLALATPTEIMPEPVTTVGLAEVAERCWTLLHEATDVVRGEAATVLAGRTAAIRAAFAALPTDASTPAMPLHGDLHAGQFLRSPHRLVVTDFDGNPLLRADDRHRPRPPAYDAVSLVQSIDHCGRVAQHRGRREVTDEHIPEALAAGLDAYRDTIGRAGQAGLLDERLVWPLRLAQELHELVYAARHLPHWAYAPTATLRALIPED